MFSLRLHQFLRRVYEASAVSAIPGAESDFGQANTRVGQFS